MKKSTLIVLAVAIALGCFVYFYDSKHTPKPAVDETSKPAFAVKAGTISSLTIHNASETVSLSKKGSDWDITQPIDTRADQTAVSSIVNDLTDLQVQRSFTPTDNLSKYGLAQPALEIDFRAASGSPHAVELGNKDFSNSSVYALVDGSKQIDMVSPSLFDDANKPVLQLRDRSILDLNNTEVTALTLSDPNGKFLLTKAQAGWEISSPRHVLADSSGIDALVSSLSSNKFTDVVSETASDPVKYGLAHPNVALDATTKGGTQFHLILTKKGNDYYGRDLSRPLIFSVDAPIYNAYDKSLFDLRDKSILQLDPSSVESVTVKNANGTIECSQGKNDQWSMVEPVADKGKQIQSWKILDPLQNTRAINIYDTPSAAVLAHLKKPEIQITLVDKSKKTTTIQVSAASGNSVYVRTSASPEIYEVGTQILTDFGFRASDLLI